MPQKTNLNTSPYFDDFDSNKDYYKVLFKPGYPIQARELTTLQSILQSQIEKFGNHVFIDGSVVIPGQTSYNNSFACVQIENTFNGIPLSPYLESLEGKIIRGLNSTIKAKVIKTLNFSESANNYITLFLNYISTNIETGQKVFLNSESLIVEETITTSNSNSFISANTEFANTISTNSTSVGSVVTLSSGVYYIRGYFVNVDEEILILDPYSNTPSYRVGFNVIEDVVNSDEDSTLTDNAQGFNNYAAPGADRFRIKVELAKKPLDSTDSENFIELLKIENGRLIKNIKYPQYNIIKDELARRTYDESGDYYVNPFNISALDTLNNFRGNNGVFLDGQITYNNNIPSESIATYKISPGKAYVKGYEVETISPTYLDIEKTRISKTIESQTLNYVTGPTYSLNRVYGSPVIGINTNYTVSLRDSRVGSSQISSTGKEIGLARVYDFGLESGGYSSTNLNLNQWDISLFDIQTYTEITFNTPTSLSVPTYIKGKSSGATAYLRYSTTNSGIATFYDVRGNFLSGEKFIFNGTEDLSRVSTAVTFYGTGDVKSLYGIVGSAYTFTADVIQKSNYPVGVVSITEFSGGISTVTTSSVRLFEIAAVGNLISYSTPGLTIPTYAKIVSVQEKVLGITSVTSVSDICSGSLPLSPLVVNDFTILSSLSPSSSDNTLYTVLPKTNISSVDLTESSLTIRRQYDVTITNNETNTISCGTDEVFKSFDEERFVLIRKDGIIEPLSTDKVKIDRTVSPEALTIIGLSTSILTDAKLIVTLEKSKIKSKVKNRNRVKSILLDKSKLSQSGIGTTTLNDGLTYGLYPYGTRIQDEDICLLTSDVTKIYGIFESNDISNPDLPSITLESIQSSNSSTNDLVIGEEIVGSQSQSVAILVENLNSASIGFIYLNNNTFVVGETLEFKESGVKAIVSSLSNGDLNITNNFIFESGQKNTFYDYSRIVKKRGTNSPTRKIKIVFEYASFSTSDNGDIITKNSYDSFDYKEILSIDGVRNSDLIDIRPSVSDFSVNVTVRSPFEFLGRSFTTVGNAVSNILASDEDITLGYSYYLPRIDRIFVSKNGVFQVSKGDPSETPQLPKFVDDAIEIATAYLPAYIYNINDIKFNILQYKRYTMKDINKLEKRIENLEYYTTLSLLETKTSNLTIKDAQGLDRFKSGFFVDNFETSEKQKKVTEVKNSIDVKNSELRPSHYTNLIDLSFGGFESNSADLDYNPEIQGSNITKSRGNIITLSYSSDEYITNRFATRVENVTPYLVTFYTGTIELNPSSDTWIDTVRLNANTIISENYIESQTQLSRQEFDEQSGFGQVIWGSWNTIWTGDDIDITQGSRVIRENNIIQQTNITTTQTGLSTRTGNSTRITRQIVGNTSLGDKTTNSSLLPIMRSRNIEFIGKRFKPNTRLYTFFDGIDVNQYCFPKLIEIQMSSGTFIVGETVVGSISSSNTNSPSIRFRSAQSNHKSGPYDSPTTVYNNSPYDSNISLSSSYSSTSSILNVDLFTLSLQSSGDFYGSLVPGMRLVGQASGAVATVSSIRIVTDNIGLINGSFFIPNPNVTNNPKFASGIKIFKLTDNPSNNPINGTADTNAEEKYFSQGKIETVQENILSIRTVRKETAILTESRPQTGTPNTVVIENVVGVIVPPPPAPLVSPPPAPVSRPVTPPPTPTSTLTPLLVTPPPITLPPVTPPPTPTPLGNLICSNGNGVYLDLRSIPISQQVSVTLTVVANESAIFHEIRIPEVGIIRENDGPRTFLLRGGRSYGPCTSPLGRVFAGNETSTSNNTSRTISGSGSRPNTQLVIEEGGDDWNDMVISTNVGFFRRCTPPPPAPAPPRRIDPLAQSFFIEESTGVFITAVDLYFQSKDNNLPVTVQIRPMSLGTPTETVFPFGEVVIDPNDVNISDDALSPTRVTFSSPIFLNGNQEYAIVLLSQSTDYKVWISRLGEADITTSSLPTSQQTIVTKQPTLGSLFKSQNASTWSPSQYDDLKFNLYRASFTSNGSINFYNSTLSVGNQQIAKLIPNPLEVSSRKIRVGLGSTVIDAGLTIGNTIIQQNSNVTGIYVGTAGSATGTLLITNPGIGYTPSNSTYTYNNVSLTSLTGSGRNATANIHIKNGVSFAATISNGGIGYQVGDVLSVIGVTTESLGRNVKFTLQSIVGNNELILDNVQGDFVVGSGYTVMYINNSGISTDLNGTGSNVLLLDPPKIVTDGLHIKVNHKNHGMHSDLNSVKISGILPDLKSTTILNVTNGASDLIISSSLVGNFSQFENVSVSSTNPGYALIENEIISYTGVTAESPGTLTGVTRSIDQTNQIGLEYPISTSITKYEFGGVSLRRINKTHDLVDVDDSIIDEPIGLDYYYIKINPAISGIDRTNGTSFPKLYFNETKNGGSDKVYSTQNIQFETLTPIVQTSIVSGTNINASVRTISATSINGSEVPFLDKGFENINLNGTNYFNSPRMVCSKINETNKLINLPNNKSFTLKLDLSTSNPLLSPVIDLHRVAMIFTTNRVNSPIQNYAADSRISTLEDDPTSFVYATEIISLENPASSIKIITGAHVNTYSDVRAFYALLNNPSDEVVYYPFPGYSNRIISGEVIDLNASDGTPDKMVSKTDKIGFVSEEIEFKDHEFSIDNLPAFRYFSIKLLGTSTNQAYPPRFRDLRVIALA